MSNSVRLIYLDCECISLFDPCIFWAEEPDEDFIQNMKRFGQTEPVLLMSDPCNLILVSGYKRVRTSIILGRKILCLELPAGDAYIKGLTYLFSNQGRNLNLEKIVSALRYFASINNISREVWKELGIKPGSWIQSLWLDWLDLPGSWDMLLAKGNICLDCVKLLKKASPSELDALYPFFSEIGWSRNNSLNLLAWLTEKSRMNKADISVIITELGLEKMLQADLSPADKVKTILRIVFRSRYPVLSNMKNELKSRLRKVSTDTGWMFEHRDEFESREIIISTRINNRQDLEKAVARLELMVKSGAFNDWPVK